MIGASVTSPFCGSSLNKGGIPVTSQRGFVFCAKPVRQPVSVTRMLPRFSTWGESAGIIFMRWSLWRERLLSPAAIKNFGRLDILVNNSGVYEYVPLEAITEELANVFRRLQSFCHAWLNQRPVRQKRMPSPYTTVVPCFHASERRSNTGSSAGARLRLTSTYRLARMNGPRSKMIFAFESDF